MFPSLPFFSEKTRCFFFPRYGLLVAMHSYGLGGKPLGSVAKFTELCREVLGEAAMPSEEHLVCGSPDGWAGAGGLDVLMLSNAYGCLIDFDSFCFLFPMCQVRVVRFYQSCSSPLPPPPRLAILLLLFLLLVLLLLLFLLDHVCINFHLNFRLANSWPSSLPTSQLSVHRWTSTWDLPSSVSTAGPQPGTFPAQCAPLDLNLGPSQLSVHRWTSTWDLPSSVCTAGPPDRMPEDMPDRVPEGMPDRMPDKMSDRMPRKDLPVTTCINVMVGITRSKVFFDGLFYRLFIVNISYSN